MFQRPKIPPAPIFGEADKNVIPDNGTDENADIFQHYLQENTSGLLQ